MKSQIKKIIGSLALIAALLVLNSSTANAFDAPGGGCNIEPDNLKGACMKSTEGVWTCIADTEPEDCTSTD